MRQVKPFMYFTDPRHPNHKEFLKLTREGPQGFKEKATGNSKGRPSNYASYNPFTKDKPKHSYVLGSPIRSI